MLLEASHWDCRLPVDTHVSRIVQRLGITYETDPVKIENAVGSMLPDDEHGDFSLRLSCTEDKCVCSKA